jgi:hypothetical protein
VWVAAGISCRTGPIPVPIDPDLWDYLQFVDRAEEAKGAGFHFICLTVSEVQPPRLFEPFAAQPELRRLLSEWIEGQLANARTRMRKADLREQAREAFMGRIITDNMFATAWKLADVPEAAKFRGRPKA